MQDKIKTAIDSLSTEELTHIDEASTDVLALTDADLKHVTGGTAKWGGCDRKWGYGYGNGWGYGYGYGWGNGCDFKDDFKDNCKDDFKFDN